MVPQVEYVKFSGKRVEDVQAIEITPASFFALAAHDSHEAQ